MLLWPLFIINSSWLLLQKNVFTDASSYSLANKNITDSDNKPILNFQQQRYIRYYNKFFDEIKVQWQFLYTAISRLTVAACSSLCMDNNECVSFFYDKNLGAEPNCYLNSKALRSDHFKDRTDMDYFELEVKLKFVYLLLFI